MADIVIDPNERDYQKYNHQLGDNDFDADMVLVDSFVQAHLEPDNSLAQAAVFNYYISQIFNYWNLTTKYLVSQEVKEDYQKYLLRSRAPYHRGAREIPSAEKIDEYQNEILNFVETLNLNFAKSRRVDIVKFQEVFNYIALVACLQVPKFETLGDDSMYPLTNTVGLFGLNTYLYAYFEGVYLLGVPIKITKYDQIMGCPRAFIQHDIEHSKAIKSRLSRVDFDFEKLAYYTIINDPEMSHLEKQCHITNLWIEIHEGAMLMRSRTGRIFKYADKENLRLMEDLAEAFHESSGGEFRQLYQSFYPIILTQDNFESLIEYGRKNKMSQDRLDAIEKFYQSEGEFLGEFKSSNSDLLLAFWLTTKYISNLYRTWKDNK